MQYGGVLLELQGLECLDQQQVPLSFLFSANTSAALHAASAIHGKRQRLERRARRLEDSFNVLTRWTDKTPEV